LFPISNDSRSHPLILLPLQVKCRKGKNRQITAEAAEVMLASTWETATDGDFLIVSGHFERGNPFLIVFHTLSYALEMLV